MEESSPDKDGLEWYDTPDRSWVAYDVEITDTEVYDPDSVVCAPTDGLKVVRLVCVPKK